MHIMLVNDDGIHAPGIRTLCRIAAEGGHRVSVCAPDRERSAVSHGISLNRPLSVTKMEIPGAEVAYAVDGTPADAARLGLYLIRDVDMVVSGINNGSNLGGACIYSGTVGAAMEASMSGTPALAVSNFEYNGENYEPAAKVTLRVMEWAKENPLLRGIIYNLNVPDLPYEQIKGVKAAPLAPTYLDSPEYEEVDAPDGVKYSYRPGRNVPLEDPDSDVMCIRQGYATLTKLTWDLRFNAPDPDVSALML